MKKTRLIDVAQYAGVSKSTVSQFLNGRYDYMSKATKESIEAAIKELNYVPNPIARSLKTDKTKTIGLIVRDVTGYYTSEAIRGIDDYCKSKGYTAIIYNTDFDPAEEAKALSALTRLHVDGIILAPAGENTEQIKEVAERGTPVVEFQIEHDDSVKNIITADYEQAVFEATEYLIDLGHKDIAFFTQEFEDVKSRRDRYLGYERALLENGLSVREELIQIWRREQGFEQSPASLLKTENPPTAFFTQHLAITTDILKDLNQAGVVIPEDVSVIGFDDLPLAEFFKVPITAIRQDSYRVGAEAAKMVLDNINDKSLAPQKLLVPCTLVARESCKKLN